MASSVILDFYIFPIDICQKFKFAPITTSTCKIWWRLDDPQPSYC